MQSPYKAHSQRYFSIFHSSRFLPCGQKIWKNESFKYLAAAGEAAYEYAAEYVLSVKDARRTI